jgi:pimeloyl-ACP methyl ester carboxylesterase
VLWGELDGSFPAACLDGLGRFVPHLTVNRFATGGHWLLREQPDAMADEMLQFLSHPSAGAIAIATPTASTTASA